MSNNRVIKKTEPLYVYFLEAFLVLMAMAFNTAVLGSEKLSVFVVNYPLQYFTQRVGGDQVVVNFPAPKNVDPAFWMPPPETITDYQQADLILLNGADYAKWVKRASLPMLKTIDTSLHYIDRYIEIADSMVHSHGDAGEHSHGEMAFTTWLDFDLAIRQAKMIAEALSRKRPDHYELFQKNLAALQVDLESLDREMIKVLARNPNQPLVASHPVYQYLARRYHIPLNSVHWEPNLVPSAEQWVELEKIVDTDHPRWMVWEDKPNQVTRRKLKTRGVSSLVFDPCANVPEQGDWLDVMRENLQNFKKAYQ